MGSKAKLKDGRIAYGCAEAETLLAQFVEAEAARARAIALLCRWLLQHGDGGATDTCGVAPDLVADTWEAVNK